MEYIDAVYKCTEWLVINVNDLLENELRNILILFIMEWNEFGQLVNDLFEKNEMYRIFERNGQL